MEPVESSVSQVENHVCPKAVGLVLDHALVGCLSKWPGSFLSEMSNYFYAFTTYLWLVAQSRKKHKASQIGCESGVLERFTKIFYSLFISLPLARLSARQAHSLQWSVSTPYSVLCQGHAHKIHRLMAARIHSRATRANSSTCPAARSRRRRRRGCKRLVWIPNSCI